MKQLKKKLITALALHLLVLQAFPQQEPLELDLATALEMAGARNLTVQEQRLLQQAAEAQLATANEWWLPELSVGMSIHYLEGAALNADGRFFLDVERQSFGAGGGVLAIWDLREGPNAVKAARQRGEAQALIGRTRGNEALLEVVQAYYRFTQAEAEARTMQQLVLLSDTIATQLGVLVDLGSAYGSDLLLARAANTQLRLRMQRALMDRANASVQLARTLDLHPATPITIPPLELVPMELPPVEEDPAAAETLLKQRPDLRGRELQYEALRTERRRTTTGLLMPQLRVGLGYSAFGDVFQPLWPTGEVNGSLVWRIPLGRLIQAGDLKTADARLEIQRLTIRSELLNAQAEVETARQHVALARTRLELAREGVAAAGEAFSQTTERQRLGMVRPLETLQAQEAAMNMHLERIMAAADHVVAQYRLRVALGMDL